MCRIVKQLSSCCSNVRLVANLLDLNNKQWNETAQSRGGWWQMTWPSEKASWLVFFFLGGWIWRWPNQIAYGVNSVGCTQIISSPAVSSWLGGDYSKPSFRCIVLYFICSCRPCLAMVWLFLDLVDMSSNIRPSNVNDCSENCIKLRNGKTVSIFFRRRRLLLLLRLFKLDTVRRMCVCAVCARARHCIWCKCDDASELDTSNPELWMSVCLCARAHVVCITRCPCVNM